MDFCFEIIKKSDFKFFIFILNNIKIYNKTYFYYKKFINN